MSELATTVQELPWVSFAPVIVLIIGGLWIWAAGRRILRAALTMAALLCGAMLGWIIGEAIRTNAAPLISAIIAAALLAALAAIAYRVAIAGAMAGIVAIAAPLLLIAYWEFRPAFAHAGEAQALPGETAAQASSDAPDGASDPGSWLDDQTRASIDRSLEGFAASLDRARAALDASASAHEPTGKHWAQLKRSTSQVVGLAKERWLQTPQGQRPMLALAAAGGALLGLLLGSLATVFSASAITSMGGSLMWLSGFNALFLRLGVPEGPWIPTSATGWLTIWLIASVAGLAIQWTFRKRPADKPA